MIPEYYSTLALNVTKTNGFTDVALYILDQVTQIDVRHTLLMRPKALISDLSGNADTVSAVLSDSGIPYSSTRDGAMFTLFFNMVRFNPGNPLRSCIQV